MTHKPAMLLVSISILALLLAGCSSENIGSAPGASAQASAGAELYQETCSHCHGPDGKGLPDLGKDLTASELMKNQDDQGLLAFVKKGRMPKNPANTTGIPMPPKGGNPSLTDEQILEIIAYVRTLEE